MPFATRKKAKACGPEKTSLRRTNRAGRVGSRGFSPSCPNAVPPFFVDTSRRRPIRKLTVLHKGSFARSPLPVSENGRFVKIQGIFPGDTAEPWYKATMKGGYE